MAENPFAHQGLYLHIPFCKRACHYCNFHFSTSTRGRAELIDAMVREIRLRRSELQRAPLATIYLGGGTPSLLTPDQLDRLFATIAHIATVLPDAEITLEANPDDLDWATVEKLAAGPVNRLSIGIQSFHDPDLRYMGRAHSAAEAIAAIQRVKAAGFDNLTIDLIYGSPTTSSEQWERNLDLALSFDPPHLSAYALTVEPQTALAHQIAKGKSRPVDENRTADQFARLVEVCTSAGYRHYELASFARDGYRSRHNSSYWAGIPYVGIGPSAHSYNGREERRWNVAHNPRYTKLLQQLETPQQLEASTALFSREKLKLHDRYNERVMTAMRLAEGIRAHTLEQDFGPDLREYFQQHIQPYLSSGHVQLDGDRYYVATRARLLADGIAADLFYLPDTNP